MSEPAPAWELPNQCPARYYSYGAYRHCELPPDHSGDHFHSDGGWEGSQLEWSEVVKSEYIEELPSYYWKPGNFWDHVERGQPKDCWPWKNGKDRKGYGKLQMGGRPTNGGKNYFAHRVAWEMQNGPIPEGKWVLHKCDNPPCCNPDHLFIGDALTNVQDMDSKGRRITVAKKGEDHPNSKLTEIEVSLIRGLLGTEFPRKDIASMFGVAKSTIDAIASGKLWKKKATVVYLAGAMSGKKDWNFPAFHKAAEKLRGIGYTVINPAEEFSGNTELPREFYMQRAIQNVLRSDIIFTLRGWGKSEGARLEVDVAKAVGKEVKSCP